MSKSIDALHKKSVTDNISHSQPVDFSNVDLTNPNDWVTMESMHEEYPHIPFPTIRYLYHQRVSKGLSPVIKKFGKQLLGNRLGFGYWMAYYILFFSLWGA